MIRFKKYHGTGNDFILIDDINSELNLKTENIRHLCDRHFGIGADGLIQIRKSKGFDFEMLYFNSDGLPGSMCGNGGRCAVAFAKTLGLIKDHARFTAYDGTHDAIIISENPSIVKLHMNDVNNVENKNEYILLNTGSPHYIRFMNDINELDIVSEGRKIRYNEKFKKEGVNVNFVQLVNGILNVRTYERGVENETLSCGTGVTASVLAASFTGLITGSECNVVTPGGELKVYFKNNKTSFNDIWLEGAAEMVYSGEVDVL